MASTHVAASGTSVQVIDLLTNQETAAEFITQRCHADAPWQLFTHTATLDKLLPGNVLKFITVDGQFTFKPREYNALPVFEQIEAGQFVAQMCPANEMAVKIDEELIKGRESEYMKAFDISMNNTLNVLNQNYFRQAVAQLINGVSPLNSGNNAGAQGGGLKLGTQATPLVIDVSNGQAPEEIYRQILDVVVAMASAKSQLDLGNCVDSWKLLVHEELLLNFSYAQSMANSCDISKSMTVGTAKVLDNLFGQTVISSSLMPKIPTATGFKTPIIMTHSQASAFYGGISSAYSDKEFAATRWIMSETRGGVVLKPQHIFVAWVELKRA